MVRVRRSRWCALGVAALFAMSTAVPAAAAPAVLPTPASSAAVAASYRTEGGEDTWTKTLKLDRPLAGWRIALDAGHNGGNVERTTRMYQQVSDGRGGSKICNTAGTTSLSGYPEHAFTFDVTARLTAQLEGLSATVLLTREDDDGVGPCVDVRGRFAEDSDADLLLSLHANGSSSPAAAGFFAITASPAISPSQEAPSEALAAAMVVTLTAAGFAPSNVVQGAISERADLATLNFARRPAVMLELGEMRNPAESAVMSSEDGRQKYADALTDALVDWARAHPLGS